MDVPMNPRGRGGLNETKQKVKKKKKKKGKGKETRGGCVFLSVGLDAVPPQLLFLGAHELPEAVDGRLGGRQVHVEGGRR